MTKTSNKQKQIGIGAFEINKHMGMSVPKNEVSEIVSFQSEE